MDDRNLTLIVVPHGDLETRSFVVTYRKLKIIGLIGLVVAIVVTFALALFFPIMLTAAKVKPLQNRVMVLETERAEVAKLAKDLAEVEAHYARVRELLGADAPVAGSAPMLPPLRDTSGAKPKDTAGPTSQAPAVPDIRRWPLAVRGFVTQNAASGRRGHPGIDIAVGNDSDIRAAGDGVVSRAGDDEVYGKYVVIDHGGGYISVYGHANRITVKQGDDVKAGDRIALSGSTGRSTAPHLHFEIRRDGEVVDPVRFVRQPQ